MTPEPSPAPSLDLTNTLPRDIYYEVAHTLRRTLPPPMADTPEAEHRRDRVAIAQVAALLPANAAEAHLAATFVAANIHALDCMGLSRVPGTDPQDVARCAAQSASMSRQARGALRLLLQMQAVRRTMEATNAAADAAVWTEHTAMQWMAQALPGASPAMRSVPTPEPAALPEPSPTPEPRPAPEPPAWPKPAPTREPTATPAATSPPAPPRPEPPSKPLAEAEFYAMLYPQRAKLIRRHGGVPDDARFGPPEDDIVHALVTGRSAALLALDQPPLHNQAA